MNKEKFLLELRQRLTVLSTAEREEAITYYEEYFNDAGIENEQAVINELGSVEKIANGILIENNYQVLDSVKKEDSQDDNAINENEMKKYNEINYGMIALIIVLIIFVAPVILPIFFGIFFTVIGLLLGGIGIIAGGSIVSIVGIAYLFVQPINGLLLFGIGLILFSIGVFLTEAMAYICGKGIPAVIRGIVKICKYPFQKGGVKI